MAPSHPNRAVAFTVALLVVSVPIVAASEADLHAHEAESRDFPLEWTANVAIAASTTTAVAESAIIYNLAR